MIVSTHQASLFPYSGFWHKLTLARVFGVTTDVKMDYGGYQNRVPLGDGWLTLRVAKDSKHQLINEVQVAEGFLLTDLIPTIKGRMNRKSHPHIERLNEVFDALSDLDKQGERRLCEINCTLLRLVHKMLFSHTEIVPIIAGPYHGATKADRLFERLERIGMVSGVYLAGPGTAAYLRDAPPHHSISVFVQEDNQLGHTDTGQSVLHFLGRYEDPLTEMQSRFTLTPLLH